MIFLKNSSIPYTALTSVPSCRVHRTANQAIPASTVTTVDFPTASMTEDWDIGPMHDGATNSTRLTAPVTGLYLVNSTVQWDVGANTNDLMLITVSGVSWLRQSTGFAHAADNIYTQCNGPVLCAAGEFIELKVFTNAGGGGKNINAVGNYGVFLSAHYMGHL